MLFNSYEFIFGLLPLTWLVYTLTLRSGRREAATMALLFASLFFYGWWNPQYVLLILAIVIAVMGIANTLSLSIHERTRELGLLRAVGQTRRQTRTMVRGEALTVALFGTVGGLGLGLFLGWAIVSALASEGFASFAVPKTSLAVVLALGALVGVLAAVRPAHRAARMDVLSAIATE